jgi:hypothetical protein
MAGREDWLAVWPSASEKRVGWFELVRFERSRGFDGVFVAVLRCLAEFFFPSCPERSLQSLLEFGRHRVGFAGVIEGDGMPDIVYDDLARVATGQVLRKFLADVRELGAIDIVV